MKFFAQILSLIFLTVTLPAVADELDDLKKKFRERAPALSKLRAAGKLGETDKGYIAPVKGAALNAAETQLMQAENRDRRAGYRIISKRRSIPEQKVGQLAGAKKIQSAKPGEWVQQGGAWNKK